MQVIVLSLSLSHYSQTFRQCLSVLPWSLGGMSSLSRNPSSGKRAHLARVNWLRARNILSVTEWPSFERGKAARLTHLGAKQAETMVGSSVSGYARARNIGVRVTDREITRGKIKSWDWHWWNWGTWRIEYLIFDCYIRCSKKRYNKRDC